MTDDDLDEEYFDDEPNVCRGCRKMAEEKPVFLQCQFCLKDFPTGQSDFRCEPCRNEWRIGLRSHGAKANSPVCEACRTSEVGSCAICSLVVTGSQAQRFGDEIICASCLAVPEVVWCPDCGQTFPYHGYLNGAFRGDRPGLHAAALVTHYRHNHVRAHDLAWQSPQYQSRIPGYDYDEQKSLSNNRAKRQLLRAIARHREAGAYPQTAPIGMRDLVAAFETLNDNDIETQELVTKILEKIDQLETVAG